MSHLLDANACIDRLRNGPASKVTLRLAAAPAGSVYSCSIVVGKLLFGARRTNRVAASLAAVRTFCTGYVCLPFDGSATEAYADVRAQLASIGRPIGANDLMIAATALANNLTLVTHNTAEFACVPGLQLDDWQ